MGRAWVIRTGSCGLFTKVCMRHNRLLHNISVKEQALRKACTAQCHALQGRHGNKQGCINGTALHEVRRQGILCGPRKRAYGGRAAFQRGCAAEKKRPGSHQRGSGQSHWQPPAGRNAQARPDRVRDCARLHPVVAVAQYLRACRGRTAEQMRHTRCRYSHSHGHGHAPAHVARGAHSHCFRGYLQPHRGHRPQVP